MESNLEESLHFPPFPPSYRSFICTHLSQDMDDTSQIFLLTPISLLLTKSYFVKVDFGDSHLCYLFLSPSQA